jgi:predicted nuclease with TOPRIM domain
MLVGKLSVFKSSYSEWKGGMDSGSERTEVRKSKKSRTQFEQPEKEIQLAKLPISKNERSRIERQVYKLEDEILNLESTLDRLGKKLENPPEDVGEVQHISEEYAYTEVKLATALGEWEALQEKLLN